MKSFRKYIAKQNNPYIIIVTILGTLGHFLYKWSGNSPIAALFFPINESTWEHLKLLFFPFLLVSVWKYFRHGRYQRNFFYNQWIAVLYGMLSIIILFFTYSGVIGHSVLIIDLLIYVFSVILTFYVADRLNEATKRSSFMPANVAVLWLAVSFLFFLFTCFPPDIPLFFPPQ